MPRLCALIAAAAAPVALALVPLGITESALLWFESYLGQRTTGDLSGRLVVWPEALAAWSDSLFLGNGPGVFPISNSMGIGAHNLVLTVGNDLGLLGLLIYVAVVASALAVAWLRSASGPRLVSVFLIALLPIWLTGHWEVAMGFWLLLAAVSVFPSAAAAPSGVRQRAAVPTRGTAVGQLRQPVGFDAGVNPGCRSRLRDAAPAARLGGPAGVVDGTGSRAVGRRHGAPQPYDGGHDLVDAVLAQGLGPCPFARGPA